MTRGDVADLRVRRRLAQIADRLDELRARNHEGSEPLPAPGADRERLLRAAGNASQARAHAAEAAQLAMAAYLRSAEVHDRVAGLYEQLAAGASDITRYQQQAKHHHMLAAKDRTLAAKNAKSAASHRGGATHTDASGPDQSPADNRAAGSG